MVHDVAQFCETVLPRFFSHANWTSFTRQLANYSFVHVRDIDDAWVFEHSHFSRTSAANLPLVARRKPSTEKDATTTTAATAAAPAAAGADVHAVVSGDDAMSSVVTRKRSFEHASAAVPTSTSTDSDLKSAELLAQHHALLQGLHKKLDVQIASQERVLQCQARIVGLLEAQESLQLRRELDSSSIFASAHLTSTSLFDLDADVAAGTHDPFCPVHNH